MGIDVMPLTNAGAGRIARLHRAGRLDEEEYSITLHLISGVYSSVWGFFFLFPLKESWLILWEWGVFEKAGRIGCVTVLEIGSFLF